MKKSEQSVKSLVSFPQSLSSPVGDRESFESNTRKIPDLPTGGQASQNDRNMELRQRPQGVIFIK